MYKHYKRRLFQAKLIFFFYYFSIAHFPVYVFSAENYY